MKNLVLFSKLKTATKYINNTLKNLAAIKTVTSSSELYEALDQYSEPIVLLHTSVYKENEEIAKQLLLYLRNTSIFVISDNPDFNEGYDLLNYSIKGYGNTYMDSVHFEQAFSLISEGNVWFYPELMNYIIQKSVGSKEAKKNNALGILSKREQDVAKLVAKGMHNKEIAKSCKVTERTVKAHISSCFEKLNVNNRLSLALLLSE